MTQTTVQPSLFISHGAPDLPLRDGPVSQFLRSLSTQLREQVGDRLPPPQAILVISAHWLTPQPTVSAAPVPKTIHDFSGFPRALYDLNYPVAGAPAVAQRAVQLLQQAGFQGALHPSHGLDHGSWTPLILAYPEAKIPVTQMSVQPYLSPAHHWKIGQAIAPLRQEGVLIIGSGSATHNLSAFAPQYDAEPPLWVKSFDHWLSDIILTQDYASLLNYRHLAPYAQDNHPSEEHLLPLFVALGAGGTSPQSIQLHQSYTYGAFSMAAYAFQ